MLWILGIIILIVFLVLIITYLYFRANKNKNLGKTMLKESEKKQKAPEVFYEKQRFFRQYYAVFKGIDLLLVVLSTVFSIITIYMVMDQSLGLNVRILCSVIAAVSASLKSAINPDRVGQGYVMAMRELENVILIYEHNLEPDINLLIQANQKAENIIENKYC